MKSTLRPCIMKVPFGALVITAGVCGILSFAFLATSLGTDHWYIIEMNPMNATDFEDVSSHSGLWRINEGRKQLKPVTLLTSSRWLVIICKQSCGRFPCTQAERSRLSPLIHFLEIPPNTPRLSCAF
ncbi:hypothetical protein CHARACLAT_013071 [Characodon lateralis]|uniref:Uncharacterized protein n=1 Tax=Characodon lateralis TaxID=208331 RepID=A0ABU7CX50_9TELE|nr:hypothetical protein [Characodon lateralis]